MNTDPRRCTKCHEEKPLSGYGFRSRADGTLNNECRPCRAAYLKQWYAKNAERERPKHKQWYEANKQRAVALSAHWQRAHPTNLADRWRKYAYGITREEYARMLHAQHGLCAICQRPERRKTRGGRLIPLAVDHDHDSGAIRALLCQGCNVGLGNFGEDCERLEQAAAYLRQHGATDAMKEAL